MICGKERAAHSDVGQTGRVGTIECDSQHLLWISRNYTGMRRLWAVGQNLFQCQLAQCIFMLKFTSGKTRGCTKADEMHIELRV